MKKMLIFIFLVSSVNLFSDSIIFNYDFIFSYLPMEALMMYEDNHIVPNEDRQLCFFTEFNSEFLIFDMFFIGGNIRSNFYKDNENYSFFPDMIKFKFFTGLRFNDNFEIGFNHFCYHPIIPYIGFRSQPLRILWEGAYEEIYIKISGSTKKK